MRVSWHITWYVRLLNTNSISNSKLCSAIRELNLGFVEKGERMPGENRNYKESIPKPSSKTMCRTDTGVYSVMAWRTEELAESYQVTQVNTYMYFKHDLD